MTFDEWFDKEGYDEDRRFVCGLAWNEGMNDAESALAIALGVLLSRYTSLVYCGDCGNWNPELEEHVIAARAVLAAVGAA